MALDRTDLTNESIKLNGAYISDTIPGLSVLKTTGRDALAIELENYEAAGDGQKFRSSRFPAREITVDYLLVADTALEFRTKYNALATLLDCGEATIIFNDESDKYYKGRFVMNDDIETTKTTRTGTITIVCNDPFKYSTTETTVNTSTITVTEKDEDGNTTTSNAKGFSVNYDGGYKCYPTFDVSFPNAEAQITGASAADCGYVMFIKGNSPDGKQYSVQCGDDKEKDITTPKLVTTNFKSSMTGWAKNNTMTLPASMRWQWQGDCTRTSKGLKASGYGTLLSGFDMGPCVAYTIPDNKLLTSDFEFRWKSVFACSSTSAKGKKQGGCQWVLMFDTNKTLQYGFGYQKHNGTSLDGESWIYDAETWQWKCSKESFKYTGHLGYKSTSDTNGRLSIQKVTRKDNYVDWRMPDGMTYSVQMETAPTIKYICFFFGRREGLAEMTSNRITYAQIINGNYDNINTFEANDELHVDCGSAEITLNNALEPTIGDVGNNWEDMYLDVGQNVFVFQHSDWVDSEHLPTVTMSYRKRWL